MSLLSNDDALLSRSGDMAALIRELDWSHSALGPPDGWPEGLRAALDVLLLSPVPMAVCWGPSFAIVYNEAYARVLGDRHPWAMGRPLFEVWRDHRALLEAAVDRALSSGRAVLDDVPLPVKQNGDVRHDRVAIWFSAIRGTSERPDGVLVTLAGSPVLTATAHDRGAASDTTQDERSHEQGLAEAKRELRRRMLEQQTLLDLLPVGIGIATDRECRDIRVNRAFGELLGVPVGANASKTAPPGERPANFRVLDSDGCEIADEQLPMQVAAREGREVRDLQIDIVRDDGRVVRLLEYAAPLFDEQGVSSGAIGAFVDVTQVKDALRTMVRSEDRYRRIFETAGVSIWEEDISEVKRAMDRLRAQGVADVEQHLATHPEFVGECMALVRILDVNSATLVMFGASDKGELLASLERGFLPETRTVFARALMALARGDRRFEAEAPMQTLDGRRIHTLITITYPPSDEPFDTVLVSLADITEQKAAETALQQEVAVRATLAHVGATLAGELNTEKLVQSITDAATELTEAEFGAFFYNVADETGDAFELYSLAGARREAFAGLPRLQTTALFAPIFSGQGSVRRDDLIDDPPYGCAALLAKLPPELQLRSCLAVPVVGSAGRVMGGLFFAHTRRGVFSEQHEQLALGVAAWAAIALDNARLYKDLENANRLKDEFLATLSHELRTPLNAVLGWSHMLRAGKMKPAMQARALESLERNARAQAQLVEDLLDVSRITIGKLHIKSDLVDLGSVISNAVETVRAGASAKRLKLDVRIPPDRTVVAGDADRLQQVVWNLVSNAIKFTPSGGRIDVELQIAESTAEICVRDTGQGIAEAFQPHIFERFRQGDASTARRYGGLGLGLSIVRHVTEAHGGTVMAESAGAGKGATFRVRLPLHSIHLADLSAPDNVAPAGGDLAGHRLLVVDDEMDARELVRYVLETRGAEVVTASSAEEAARFVESARFDAMVADIGMPGQDGYSLIRWLRSLPADEVRTMPAIAVTAYAGLRERELALDAGFDWHLAKPVEPDQLIAAVAASTMRRGNVTGHARRPGLAGPRARRPKDAGSDPA